MSSRLNLQLPGLPLVKRYERTRDYDELEQIYTAIERAYEICRSEFYLESHLLYSYFLQRMWRSVGRADARRMLRHDDPEGTPPRNLTLEDLREVWTWKGWMGRNLPEDAEYLVCLTERDYSEAVWEEVALQWTHQLHPGLLQNLCSEAQAWNKLPSVAEVEAFGLVLSDAWERQRTSRPRRSGGSKEDLEHHASDTARYALLRRAEERSLAEAKLLRIGDAALAEGLEIDAAWAFATKALLKEADALARQSETQSQAEPLRERPHGAAMAEHLHRVASCAVSRSAVTQHLLRRARGL